MWYPVHPGMDENIGVQASMTVLSPVRKGTKDFECHAQNSKNYFFGVFLPYERVSLPAWPSMAEHGRAWPSMAEHGRAWPSMAEHGIELVCECFYLEQL